jgi:TRAP-type C4-dicarboxylate transport system substrate-binding protein
MKKILALMLALMLTLSLAACSSSSSDDSSSGSNDTSSTNTSDNSSTSDSSTADNTGGSASYDEVTLTFTVANNETETGGMLVKHFTDYVTEQSGGAVKFDISYGGTLCSSSENLDFVGSGAVDMCMTGTSEFTAQLPLTNFPSFVYGSQQDALDYANYIAFENEETAKLIADEMAAAGVVTVGMNAGGGNAYFFKSDYSTLADATKAGLVLGVGSNLGCYEALGFNVTSTMPWDCYDQLSKGVIDCTQMAFAPGVSMSWQEVAPYVLVNNQFAFGNWWLVNSDVWASLSADTQALFYAAAEETESYSVELYATDEDAAVTTVENDGGTVYYMTEEEMAQEEAIFFEQSYADCRAAASSAGVSDQMETILAATNAYLGLDIQ